MTNTWPGIGYKIPIPSIHQPTTLVATCPLSRGRGTRRCWDQQPMWMADMVRGRINNSKICDPKTDVKEFYSILGIWWESYQIYYIDCLQNSWRMFSITSNIISSLSQLMIQAGMIKKGAVATAFIKMCNFCFAMLLIIFFLNLLLLQSVSDPYINSFCSTATLWCQLPGRGSIFLSEAFDSSVSSLRLRTRTYMLQNRSFSIVLSPSQSLYAWKYSYCHGPSLLYNPTLILSLMILFSVYRNIHNGLHFW